MAGMLLNNLISYQLIAREITPTVLFTLEKWSFHPENSVCGLHINWVFGVLELKREEMFQISYIFR
jgi:hypothetical protein